MPPSYFDDLYRADADPWKFATSDYESEKYLATLKALPRERYEHALEVGCSIGVFTYQLAKRCDHLTAIDVAESALARARQNCVDAGNIAFARLQAPSQWPDGAFDLVLLSEVLYYLDRGDVAAMGARIERCLNFGGEVVLVHWLGQTNYPLTGDEAAELFIRSASAFTRVVDGIRVDAYRLDVLRHCL